MVKLAREGTTMVVVTHEMGFAENVADRVIFMEHGYVVEDGPAKEIFNNPKEAATRKFLRRILRDSDENADQDAAATEA